MKKKLLTESGSGWLDCTGIVASWACAVHCLVLPLAVSILPLVGLSLLLSETAERVFIGISILIAALSLIPAYFRQHGKIRALVLFVSGVGLIIISQLLLEDELIMKILFLTGGAIFITAAHLLNRRLCRACVRC